MTDRAHMPETTLPGALCYEDLLGRPARQLSTGPSSTRTPPPALCYTSGTTGNPKGALYTHRSTVLHALMPRCSHAGTGCAGLASVLPVVPLFHVNAWGLPYVAPLAGATLVFPGPQLDGESLFELMEAERVIAAWGVPTVWLGLLAEIQKRRAACPTLRDAGDRRLGRAARR